SPATAGSISSSGLYTAPSTVAIIQIVTITATSAADPTKSASATVTLQPLAAISISITPTTATIRPGGSTQLTASVTGTSNSAVKWSISPTWAGSITGAGMYSAPATVASLQPVTITATSVADNITQSTATVILATPVQVSLYIAPTMVTMAPGATTTFTATVQGTSNTAVVWGIRSGGGTINASGQ